MDIEVKDKRKTIESLTRALQTAREHEKQVMLDSTREWEDKLHKQKGHYEAGMERHLKLVDRLLNDKTELTKRCELFTEELKVVEQKFQRKLEDFDEQASKELERQKKNWMAAERLRRESWEKDKVKEIKEMTIKGLQPDVERILSERKQERRRLEERHQEASDAQRKEFVDLAQVQLREAREKLAQEHERSLEEEREVHRRRAREEFDRLGGQLAEERARCAADLLAERRRHERALLEGSDGFDSRLREAVAQEHSKGEAQIRELLAQAAESQSRHRAELSELQQRLEENGAERCREIEQQAKAELERREAALRQELAHERDRQLDVLMERLSCEHVEQQQASREETEAQLQHVRDQAGAEAKHLTEQLEETKRRLEALGAQKSLSEQSIRNLEDRRSADEKRISDLEDHIRQLQADCESLQKEAEQALERHRDELWRASEMKERELDAVRTELKRADARAEEELTRAAAEREAAGRCEEQVIGDLEARVKRTLQAKDETIGELRTRCVASENKVREFEYLLARQREELLCEITRKTYT